MTEECEETNKPKKATDLILLPNAVIFFFFIKNSKKTKDRLIIFLISMAGTKVIHINKIVMIEEKAPISEWA